MEDLKQKSSEWHQARLGVFTASEVFKLIPNGKKERPFSETGYTYIKQKAGEILTSEQASSFQNTAMQWGNEYEGLARQWYQRLRYKKVHEVGFFKDKRLELLGGSPDGICEDCIIEIKCPFETHNFIDLVMSLKNGDFKIDYPNYYWQVQANMHITGKNKCDFIVFDPRIDSDCGIFICEIDYNSSDMTELLTKIDLAVIELNKILEYFKK